MKGVWVCSIRKDNDNQTEPVIKAFSSLPVLFSMVPELEPFRRALYRQPKATMCRMHLRLSIRGAYHDAICEVTHVPMFRPEDV